MRLRNLSIIKLPQENGWLMLSNLNMVL